MPLALCLSVLHSLTWQNCEPNLPGLYVLPGTRDGEATLLGNTTWGGIPAAGFLIPPSGSHPPIEAIVESALYKCVLKPLKEAIYSCLREIHSKDGSLQQLKDNQLVILATTTTDLGVTTSVPEVPVMEKILQKFSSMHKAYSPEKKISILLKTCKLIYDSMALGNPGRWAAGRGPGLRVLSGSLDQGYVRL